MKILITVLFLLFVPQSKAETINIPPEAELLFASNFEGISFNESGVTKTEVTGNAGNFQGSDTSLAGNGYPIDWKAFADSMGVNRSINAIGPTINDGSAAIVDDPTGSGRGKVLRFRSTQLAEKTRVQVNSGLNGVNTFTNSIMVYIPSNIQTLSTYPSSVNWFTLGEFMMAPDFSTTAMQKCLNPPLYQQNVDCVPNYRVGLDLKKVDGKMVFALYGDYAGKILTDAQKAAAGVSGYPTNGLTKTDWFTAYSTQEPLYDQWVTLTFYYERYPNRTDGKGRVVLKMTTAAGVTSTLIDVADVVVTDFITADRRYGTIKTNPIKLYTASYFVQHIFDNSDPNTMLLYWDNWRIFRGNALPADGAASTVKYPSKPTGLTLNKSGPNINLSWAPPTTFTDGSAISGITGYDVRTGGESTLTTTWTRFVTNQAETTLTVTPATLGRNCFLIRAVTATGNGYWSDEVCLDTAAGVVQGGNPLINNFTYAQSVTGSVSTLTITSAQAFTEGSLIIMCYTIPSDKNMTLEGGNGFTIIQTIIGDSSTTNVARTPKLQCLQKIAGASEPLSHTFTASGGNSERIQAFMVDFTNPKSSTPVAASVAVQDDQASSLTLPAMTGGVVDATILSVVSIFDNSPTPTLVLPSGYTQDLYQLTSLNGRVSSFWVGHKQSTDGNAAAAVIGGGAQTDNYTGIHILISGQYTDTIPDAFGFTDTSGHQNNSPLGAINTACTAPIAGLAASAVTTITSSENAEFKVNNGAFGSTPLTVGNGDIVCVRTNASDYYSTPTIVTVTIGGVSADYVVTTLPVPPKQFIWSEAAGNAIVCFNASTGLLTPFTGNMAIKITDADYFDFPTAAHELAFAPVVAFVDGEGVLTEEMLTSGSINAHEVGNHGYNYWATDSTCRVDNTIPLSAE